MHAEAHHPVGRPLAVHCRDLNAHQPVGAAAHMMASPCRPRAAAVERSHQAVGVVVAVAVAAVAVVAVLGHIGANPAQAHLRRGTSWAG